MAKINIKFDILGLDNLNDLKKFKVDKAQEVELSNSQLNVINKIKEEIVKINKKGKLIMTSTLKGGDIMSWSNYDNFVIMNKLGKNEVFRLLKICRDRPFYLIYLIQSFAFPSLFC